MVGEPRLTIADVVQRLGSPEEIRKDLEEFKRSALTFSSDRPRLIDEYREQWVAVLDGAVVAHADALPAVMEVLDERKLPRSKVLVRFIDENVRTMIL